MAVRNWFASTSKTPRQEGQVSFGSRFSLPIFSFIFLLQCGQANATDCESRFKSMGIPLDMVDVEIKSYHFGVPVLCHLPGFPSFRRAAFPPLGGFFILSSSFVKSHDRIMRLFSANKNVVLDGVTTCASRM
jgi:hypothetical protein